MSASSGPSILTDGLVFDYDMSNTQKSFIGKPTTNLVITKVENYTGWTGAGWWMHPGNTTSITSQTLPNGDTGPTLTATTLTTGGLYGYNGYALGAAYANGTQYTVSFWAKSYNGTPSLAVRDADSGGTLSTGVTGITSAWTRFSFTWTANASTNMLTFTGSNFSLYNVQLETNSFATPFVVGTRSSTQAIVDLTGKNVTTATSLTYVSDGTFSYNGTSDYLEVTQLSSYLSNSITVCTFAKISSVVSKNNLLSLNGVYNFFLPGNRLTTTYQLYWDSASSWKNGNKTDWATNQWYHLAWTISGTTLIFYVNGVADGTVTLAGNIAPSGTSRLGLANAGEYATGSIGTVQVYNRALSATEVQQNFNAQRTRYGI